MTAVAHSSGDPGKAASRLLIVSQVYVPDPAAVGQYLADFAKYAVDAGTEVEVLTSARGYEDPNARFPAREVLDGVRVRRLAWSSLGKSKVRYRILGQLLFLLQVAARVVFTRADSVLVSTSPPFAHLIGVVLKIFRPRIRVVWWVMDLNPDQILATGKLTERSLFVRGMRWLNRVALRRFDAVVSLDEFMENRLRAQAGAVGAALDIIPPWPLEAGVDPRDHRTSAFRSRHADLEDLVILFSGNHSPVHPLSTLLDVALACAERRDIKFLFVGGGAAKADVERFQQEHQLSNVVCLPYQPFETLSDCLAAGDLHVVAMGAEMVGIVHPCKVYNSMLANRPVLLLGPSDSHVGRILDDFACGWGIDHGDAGGLTQLIQELAAGNREELRVRGARARQAVLDRFSRRLLARRLLDLLQGSDASGTASLNESSRGLTEAG